MIQKSQFRMTTCAVQLGNGVTWLKNQSTQQMGLTATQSETIRYILKNHAQQPLTAGDLMQALRLSQSTVAGVIQRLEDKGLIYRAAAPEDGRKQLLHPTAQGLALEEQLKQNAVDIQAILLRDMTAEEQEMFHRLLEKALDNIWTARMERGNTQ